MGDPGWPLRNIHSPRAERITENSPVTPSAIIVQMKKNAPLELKVRLPMPTPLPTMIWK